MTRPRLMKTLIEWLLSGAVLLLWYGAASAAYEATPPAAPATAASAAAGLPAASRPAPPPARAKSSPRRVPAMPREARHDTRATWLCACVHPRDATGGAMPA